jgi:hypothetical protein
MEVERGGGIEECRSGQRQGWEEDGRVECVRPTGKSQPRSAMIKAVAVPTPCGDWPADLFRPCRSKARSVHMPLSALGPCSQILLPT